MNFEQTAYGQLELPVLIVDEHDTELDWDSTKVCETAVVAHRDSEIVALLAYLHLGKTLNLHIAWVHPDYRRQGLSKQMMQIAIETTNPSIVRCEAVTREGASLMKWVESAFDVEVQNPWKLKKGS